MVENEGDAADPGGGGDAQGAGNGLTDFPDGLLREAEQVFRNEGVGFGPGTKGAREKLVQNGDGGEDAKGELEAGTEELIGVEKEKDESGGTEGVEEIGPAIGGHAEKKHGGHDGGSDGGRGEAGDEGVAEQQGDQEGRLHAARDAEAAQEKPENHADDGNVQAADGEDVEGAAEPEGDLHFRGGGVGGAEGHGEQHDKLGGVGWDVLT